MSSVSSSPEPVKFQAVGEIQIDRKGGETTATQKITYNGHEYEVEVKLKGTGHSDSEMKTHMQESLEKTKLFAKSLGLGTEVSAFSFGGDQTFSAHNMQGGQMTNEQLKAKLEEAKTKYEEKKVLFQETRETKRQGKLKPDSAEFQNKAEKLDRKIQTLSQLTAILGKQSREDDVEIGIRQNPSPPPSSPPPSSPPPALTTSIQKPTPAPRRDLKEFEFKLNDFREIFDGVLAGDVEHEKLTSQMENLCEEINIHKGKQGEEQLMNDKKLKLQEFIKALPDGDTKNYLEVMSNQLVKTEKSSPQQATRPQQEVEAPPPRTDKNETNQAQSIPKAKIDLKQRLKQLEELQSKIAENNQKKENMDEIKRIIFQNDLEAEKEIIGQITDKKNLENYDEEDLKLIKDYVDNAKQRYKADESGFSPNFILSAEKNIKARNREL